MSVPLHSKESQPTAAEAPTFQLPSEAHAASEQAQNARLRTPATVGVSIITGIMILYSEYSYRIRNLKQNDIGNYLGLVLCMLDGIAPLCFRLQSAPGAWRLLPSLFCSLRQVEIFDLFWAPYLLLPCERLGSSLGPYEKV